MSQSVWVVYSPGDERWGECQPATILGVYTKEEDADAYSQDYWIVEVKLDQPITKELLKRGD